MSTKPITIHPLLLDALNKIAEAGFQPSIEPELTGGNNHTNTYMNIRTSPVAVFRVCLTTSYGQFSNWAILDRPIEIDELADIEAVIEHIKNYLNPTRMFPS